MVDVLFLCIGCVVVLCVIQLLRLIKADCDLVLQWATCFGKSPKRLRGKVVWVTGASSGIGESLVYELASVGCRLVLSARREEELNRVKKQCLTCGPLQDNDIMVVPLDMVKQHEHADAVKKVLQHFKQIDILVNNAGRSQRAEWVKTSVDVDREMLETNVLGPLSLTKAVLPDMIARRDGHIVVMSSVAGKVGAPLSGSYTGSKHAIQGWFECLWVEQYPNNIKVTMVCPGPVFSNLLAIAMTEEKGKVVGGEMKAGEKRMATSRCASLTAVAIANQLDEVWIALHPVLAFTYMFQYFPSFARRQACKIGLAKLKKMREGQ
ncbi:dehydrogenase/reductase SDR family member 7-like isoform X2 [Haliotis rubra]|nr:dehydrogenase/reductase SDR family member 7-like isoform X2 [Haliotis rubra]XP_046579851.1 dehydrogenase/reductase SDR family member 7-like isoform X2 [Haliotis rubra]XP_046579852.1 dehydrogenase/reductase SDR family member 7-like isoform X2 [Haliotis rubra]XP_046579853.1 dehydrogenase/reductase SDR family member 7-like isoform X2 [Haliotis rubra]XP_046579854.1 dehydrogenase/reductase SDR family member 7-like isoform X2 [Haliotis rubra]XP_046579855.1 dehydrogenase/reductase SDR family membe